MGAFKYLLKAYKISARKRGYAFDLTEEQFGSITQQNCHCCGIKPNGIVDRKDRNRSFTYNGLDRVDNTKGYTMDNIVPCCKICNQAKGKLTLQEFQEWIRRIYAKNNSPLVECGENII